MVLTIQYNYFNKARPFKKCFHLQIKHQTKIFKKSAESEAAGRDGFGTRSRSRVDLIDIRCLGLKSGF